MQLRFKFQCANTDSDFKYSSDKFVSYFDLIYFNREYFFSKLHFSKERYAVEHRLYVLKGTEEKKKVLMKKCINKIHNS